MRADLYYKVVDFINAGTLKDSGCVIFSSIYTRSDRYMIKTCKNSMALLLEFNKPTFFNYDSQSKVVLNSKWTDI